VLLFLQHLRKYPNHYLEPNIQLGIALTLPFAMPLKLPLLCKMHRLMNKQQLDFVRQNLLPNLDFLYIEFPSQFQLLESLAFLLQKIGGEFLAYLLFSMKDGNNRFFRQKKDLLFLQKPAALIRTAAFRYLVKYYRRGNMEKPNPAVLIACPQQAELLRVRVKLRAHI